MHKFTKFLLVSLLTFPLFLTGCAISTASKFNNQLNQAVAYSKKCSSDIAQNPDVILTYEQIVLKGLNPPNRAELLSSDQKLTDTQKIFFQNFLKLDASCDEGTLAILKDSPYETLARGSDALSAIVDSNLLTDKISIGESNAKRLEIKQKFLSDVTLLRQSLNVQVLQEAASADAISQTAINNMNTSNQIRQNQMTQQLLQQNQYKVPTPCIGLYCR